MNPVDRLDYTLINAIAFAQAASRLDAKLVTEIRSLSENLEPTVEELDAFAVTIQSACGGNRHFKRARRALLADLPNRSLNSEAVRREAEAEIVPSTYVDPPPMSEYETLERFRDALQEVIATADEFRLRQLWMGFLQLLWRANGD